MKGYTHSHDFYMPKITYVSHAGDTTQVDVPVNTSVMEGAIQNGIDGIVAECGGNALCATCHVYVDEQFLALLIPADETESAMLEATASERKANSRLSCQLNVKPALEGLVVHMPEFQK
jgi:2Fe-2S ferredoxin